MWTLLLLAAGATAPIEEAQIAYMRCLSEEADTAIRYNIEPRTFAQVVGQLCEHETRAYRAAAVTLLLNTASEQPGFDAKDARVAAEARFAAVDEANRAEMVTSFGNRMRVRRAPGQPMETASAARR